MEKIMKAKTYLLIPFLLLATLAQAQIVKKDAQGQKTIISTNGNVKLSDASPEDITNENYPDLIESFDYPNADITDVIKAISQLTGKNFIVDANVKGKITIMAPTQITVAEAYKAFLSALASLSYTVVPSGKFLKIKSSRVAKGDSIETYSGSYFPDVDQLITRIVKLKYINAKQVESDLRILNTKDGEMRAYEATNSLIITDYGSNITRISKVINELDVPGFEEQMAVMAIKHAKAKDIADLLDKIINKDSKKGGSRFSSSRFSRSKDKKSAGAEQLSIVIPDDRTNSLIVVGTKAGVTRVKTLVKTLDFRLSPEDSGGVYVYYVKHGDAEKIATTLSGVAKSSTAATKKSTSKSLPNPTKATKPIFGGDIQITAEKSTNSLIITASKQDYEVVKNLLSKIDMSRDQVYVKVVIMEMNAGNGLNWGVDLYQFNEESKGVGRIGFRTSKSVESLLNPASDQGLVLGLGEGNTFQLGSAAGSIEVASTMAFVNFLKNNVGGNILSTPQIMIMNNEEATLEVGDTVPVVEESNATDGVVSSGIKREPVNLKLVITPFISPDSDTVRMAIDQKLKQISTKQVEAANLKDSAIVTSERNIKTTIVVDNKNTAVLGGLMQDSETISSKKVPILGDIPILGWLFKSKSVTKSKTNLVVFITPTIIRGNSDIEDILTQKINERIDYIQKNMNGKDPHGFMIDSLPRISQGNSDEKPENKNLEEPAVETF
ncbi:MAG: type II secretion system secretin GspD [Bdellovibrionaceae bacterium]|jgi:general secretion pathway protein D|nr:type II secretion system secretin GspD [Pseudobdellovibrionaceae bacterium]